MPVEKIYFYKTQELFAVEGTHKGKMIFFILYRNKFFLFSFSIVYKMLELSISFLSKENILLKNRIWDKVSNSIKK